MRSFVDENLTPDLAELGNARGYFTTSSRDLGLLGRKDFQLIPFCIDHDYVLMTIDEGDPKALAEASGLHPGLIFLDAYSYEDMFRLAGAALDYIEQEAAAASEDPASFMVNKVVEVVASGNCSHFDLP